MGWIPVTRLPAGLHRCMSIQRRRREEGGRGAGGSLQHGLTSKSVKEAPVEEGVEQGKGSFLVPSQGTDEAKAVDGLLGVDGDCVDKGDEGQPIAQCEADDAGRGQQRLCRDLHIWYLRGVGPA